VLWPHSANGGGTQGYFQETLNDAFKEELRREGRKIGFAFLDCNLSSSYKVCFEFLEVHETETAPWARLLFCSLRRGLRRAVSSHAYGRIRKLKNCVTQGLRAEVLISDRFYPTRKIL
jgi:hypothetical protein